jgi:hypothetical protein
MRRGAARSYFQASCALAPIEQAAAQLEEWVNA